VNYFEVEDIFWLLDFKALKVKSRL